MKNITGDIDAIWDSVDADKNGMMDRKETRAFL
jgi:hypothetical protein